MTSASHIPIMVTEVLECLEDARLETFFDGTLGAGGHARAILEAHPEIRRYIGCDKDPEALEIARKNLAPWAQKMEFVHGDASLPLDPGHVNRRLQGGQRDVHIGWIGGDAMIAGAEDGQGAVRSTDGRTTGAGFALIAGKCGVAKINTPRPLQEVSSRGRHVSKLRRGAV